LAFFCSFFQTSFYLDDQAAATFPHKSRTLLHSPNRLKSHPMFDLRPPDPGGSYQHVSHDQPENIDGMPPKMRKRWMHRELESLRELNGNTSPSSSQGSNHSRAVRLSESPGNSSTSAVSLGSPAIAPSKLTKEPSLGITYSNGYGHGVLLYLSFRMFSFDFYFLVQINRSVRMIVRKTMNGTGWTMRLVTLITIVQRACLLHRCQLI
jgi:hypothetical protein